MAGCTWQAVPEFAVGLGRAEGGPGLVHPGAEQQGNWGVSDESHAVGTQKEQEFLPR